MTGPINFNPFSGANGTDKIEEIKDRRHNLRFPDIDLSPLNLSMNQEQDDEGIIDLDLTDFKNTKK